MTPEQQAAFIHAQSACALITAMGMQAANERCRLDNEYPRYGESDFKGVLNQFIIQHNDVITEFRR